MDLFQLMGRALVVFTSMPVHEFAHAWVANKLGDPTAKNLDRLDMNPFKHLDFVGTFLILFVGFGWAKPVPVNPNNFKEPKKGMALTALAGPVSNLILATICLTFWKILQSYAVFNGVAGNSAIFFATDILLVMIMTNISLAVFNLFPIPPLDGWNILSFFIPAKYYVKVISKQRDISMIFMLIILFTPILNIPMSFLSSKIIGVLDFATGFVTIGMKMLFT